MSFSSKNITQTTKRGISFLKGATFFFLGMSLVLFVTRAFEVVPTTQNFVSYFQKMFLTPDGFNTPSSETVILDGVAGDASFAGTVTGATVTANTLCLTSDSCITTWPVGGGSASAAGNTTNIQFNGGSANFSGSDALVWDSANGRLGIGTNSPQGRLDIVGSSNEKFLFTSDWLGALGAMVLINSDISTNTGLLIGQNGSDVAINNYDGQLSLGTKGNIGLSINSSGNVGVNHELFVANTGNFSQNVFIDNGNLLFGEGQKYIHLPIRTAPPGTNRIGYDLSIKAGDSSSNMSASTTSGGNLYLQGGDVSLASLSPNDRQGGNVYIQGGIGADPYGNVLLAYSGGNVGIGTGTPSAKLHVDGDVKIGNNLKLYNAGLFGLIESSSKLQFNTSGDNTRMTIDTAGHVGIGESSPTATLDVLGSVKILSNMTGKTFTSTGGILFPSGVTEENQNNTLSTDSIRYIFCMPKILFLSGSSSDRGAYIFIAFSGDVIDNNNLIFRTFNSSVLTYHLRAGDVFALDNQCTEGLMVYTQSYGKINNGISGGSNIPWGSGSYNIITGMALFSGVILHP